MFSGHGVGVRAVRMAGSYTPDLPPLPDTETLGAHLTSHSVQCRQIGRYFSPPMSFTSHLMHERGRGLEYIFKR